MVIEGIFTEAQLSTLKNLNNNSNSGTLQNLVNISLPNQTGNIPDSCFYYGFPDYTAAEWLKSFSAPKFESIGFIAFDDCEILQNVKF